MRIFLAGAAGAIGRRLSPLLVADGHTVMGTTRSAEKAAWLRATGIEPIVVDVYDAAALRRAVVEAQPDVVMHQLTDLPRRYSHEAIAAALPRNARIRDEGTRHLVAAAQAAGATRFIAQSIAFRISPALEAFEAQILTAPMDGIVLRYGQFYGPGTWVSTPPSEPPVVHVDAAARAACAAVRDLEPGLYVVTDDGIAPQV